jgi:hypothetical protein
MRETPPGCRLLGDDGSDLSGQTRPASARRRPLAMPGADADALAHLPTRAHAACDAAPTRSGRRFTTAAGSTPRLTHTSRMLPTGPSPRFADVRTQDSLPLPAAAPNGQAGWKQDTWS